MNIQRILITRLFLAWLAISALAGSAIYYFETERIDERVLALAIAAEQELPVELITAYNRGEPVLSQIEAFAHELGRTHFAIVELYNREAHKIVEQISPGREHLEEALSRIGHEFPRGDEIQYEKHWIDDEFLLQVLIPIRTPQGVEGYFEGVYLADPGTVAQIREDVIATVLIAMAVILATTLLLYPVILSLNRRVIAQSRDLLHSNLELMEVLGSAIAKRDSDTNIHNFRVALYAVELAEAIGVEREEIRHLIAGAFLHDVGKIGISDNILLKPGQLTEEEFEVMKTHVSLGVDILTTSGWLHQAREVVEFHHEKYDGSGYMQQLAGTQIPLSARIFAIVDVFDALTSKRPYKEPMSFDTAMEILDQDAGSHFDPELIDAFRGIAEEIHAILSQADDQEIISMLNDKTEKYFFD